MKEKLLERLQLMDKAILEQHQVINKSNADMNMLHGCRQELVHIINMCDEAEKSAEVVCEPVPLDACHTEHVEHVEHEVKCDVEQVA